MVEPAHGLDLKTSTPLQGVFVVVARARRRPPASAPPTAAAAAAAPRRAAPAQHPAS
jgi:hypothetical protein